MINQLIQQAGIHVWNVLVLADEPSDIIPAMIKIQTEPHLATSFARGGLPKSQRDFDWCEIGSTLNRAWIATTNVV